MEGSVLNFLKAEWKVSDTGSAHWASNCNLQSRVRAHAVLVIDLYELLGNPTT
jgi:hypothetical protein